MSFKTLNLKQKVFSGIVATTLALSMLPCAAFADEDDASAAVTGTPEVQQVENDDNKTDSKKSKDKSEQSESSTVDVSSSTKSKSSSVVDVSSGALDEDATYRIETSGNGYNISRTASAYEMVELNAEFFASICKLMPGETTTGEVTLKNQSGISKRLWFWGIDNVPEEADDSHIYDYIYITITRDDDILYNDNITALLGKDNRIDLGVYKPDVESTLNFEAYMMEDIEEMQLASNAVTWSFDTENLTEEQMTAESIDYSEPLNQNNMWIFVIIGVIVLGAVIAILITYLTRRKNNDENTNDDSDETLKDANKNATNDDLDDDLDSDLQ